MKTFLQFYQELQEDRYFERLALNPQAQFGSEQQSLLGATLLPERLVQENSYEETQVRYRTKPALDGTRYSPTQMQRAGHLIGSVKVDLGHTDVADQFTGQDHDGLIKLLNRGGDEMALAQAIQWVDKSLIRPHVIKNELQRWETIVKGQVTRQGSNGYEEIVNYYQHPGHHVTVPSGTQAAPQGWYLDSYDPFEDIFAGVQKLEDLGYSIRGMYSTGKLTSVLQRNSEVVKRASRVVVNGSGQITSMSGRITMSDLNAIADEEGFPAFTKYNAGYETENGFKRYLDLSDTSDYLVLVGNTNRQWDMATDYAGAVDVDLGDEDEFNDAAIQLENTLGYYAVGRNVGKSTSGRTVFTEAQERKPAGMFGEAYQTGLPVILDPQALYIIEVQRPTA